MDKSSILAKFDFFQVAPSSFQKEMEAQSRIVRLERDAFFYHEGDHCPQFALIGSGNIRVFKISEQGRQITLYHLRDGETCLVNMLCAFLNNASPASAQAESTVDALLIPASVFREWVKTVDIVREHVFERMSSRIVEVMMLVEEVAFRRMDRRVSAFLLQHSQSPGVRQGIILTTHEEIAAELGTAREVVSRVLKDLEHLGAIEIARGQLELRNAEILRDLSER
jgi:CRP/FNR family transcriptional regulator, anaerobic regulatory protein